MDDRTIIDSSDWIVSDLIKESAAEATVPPQELPYTHITSAELKILIEKHKEWLESRGTRGARFDFPRADLQALDFTGMNLQGANLNKANFRGAELLLADLRGASLVQTDFREANLLGTDFRGANLEGACLEGVAGLSTLRMSRARLFSAVLPASISIFEGENTASFRMQKCYRFLMIMLAVTVLCLLRIVTTRDIQFLCDAPTLPIPRLGALMPLSVFYLIVPVALFGLFLYFHISLANLRESLAGLPAVFPDGHVMERRGPWLLTEMLRSRANENSWSWKDLRIQSIIASLLAYWCVPAILVLFWARYLVMQDLHASMMHILLIALSLAVGTVLPQMIRSAEESPIARAPSVSVEDEELEGTTDQIERAQTEDSISKPEAADSESSAPVVQAAPLVDRREKTRRNSAIPRLIAIGNVAVFLGILTFGIVYGAPSDAGNLDFGRASIRRWSSGIFWALGYGPYARLNESTVSELPVKWSWRDEDLAQVKGPQLNKLRLRYAQGYQTTWVNAHLWKADLRGSYFSDSDFRGTNLREANLRSSALDHSRLYRANLQSADLENANFTRADLRETDLSYARLSNAMMVDAQLGHSNLFRADLHSARLEHSDLENADLRDANLANANLRLANLQAAYLWSAKLGGADLSDAQGSRAILIESDLRGANLKQVVLRGAILRGADLTGADISGADFREVSGLSADQVCSAKAHRGALLEESLASEVEGQCGSSAAQTLGRFQSNAAGTGVPAGAQ